MPKQRRPKMLACRYCGDECDTSSAEHYSAWCHGHPSVCPYRQDRVPSLNGVHVGDIWKGRYHENAFREVVEIRLGGDSTYTDREPVVVTQDAESEHDRRSEWPLWCLVEHNDPVTRPGEYPVPWKLGLEDGSRQDARWAADEWRCPGYRGGHADNEDRDKAYWHAYHTVVGHGIQWERTNELWQIDPARLTGVEGIEIEPSGQLVLA